MYAPVGSINSGWWWGVCLLSCLAVQMVVGVGLAAHYVADGEVS
jgi:quinol-cytochrome oxidoreductase complex cytochrome b subunit